jgi:O-antigen ligase
MTLDRAHPAWSLVEQSSTPSVDHSRTTIELIKLFGVASIFAAGVILGQSRRRTEFFINMLTTFAAIYGLWAFLSFVLAPDTIMGFGEKALFPDRLTASFLSANTAGTVFGMALVIAVGVLIQRLMNTGAAAAGRPRLAATLSTGALPTTIVLVTATALMLTASRTAILATGVALTLLVLAEAALRRWSAKFFFGVLLPSGTIAMIGALLLSGSLFLARIAVVSNETLSRAMIYGSHWRVIKASPSQGFGLGSFEEVHHSLLTPETLPYVWDVRAMHNVYMQWLEGAGWLGALPMFLCCLALLVLIAWKAVMRQPLAYVSRMILGASAVLLLHGFTDFALENPSVAGFWACLLGVGAGAPAGKRQKNNDGLSSTNQK